MNSSAQAVLRLDQQSPKVSRQAPDVACARHALCWATAVSENPGALDSPVTRPSVVSLRALRFEEVREHMDRQLMTKHADHALDALRLMGVLDVWLPEVAAMVGFGDGEWRHKDVWRHTKQVVRQSVPRLAVRWGSLLHDVGKPRTRSIDARGEVHFYGHAEVGAAMFRRRLADRLGFEGELRERIHFLILYHLRASHYDGTWTDSAVRRFAREMGPGLKDLLDLSRADITTKRPEKRKRGLRSISELSQRVQALQERDAHVPPLPKGLGHALMHAFDVPPSKRLGDLRKQLESLCERGELEAGQPAEYYLDHVRRHRSSFGV